MDRVAAALQDQRTRFGCFRLRGHDQSGRHRLPSGRLYRQSMDGPGSGRNAGTAASARRVRCSGFSERHSRRFRMFDFTRVVLVASVAGLAACTAMEQKPTPVTGGYFVFFEDRSAELTPDARAVVARVADDAAAVRPAVVRVTGYTRRSEEPT